MRRRRATSRAVYVKEALLAQGGRHTAIVEALLEQLRRSKATPGAARTRRRCEGGGRCTMAAV